jgi:ubiquinone/menaquinone biosynthesis C-methylase UbiE
MKKETYWSRFADDFEEKSNYVVGKSDINIVLNKLSEQKNLKNTLELACGNGQYSKVLAKRTNKLIATDFSDEMLNVAKNQLSSISNIEIAKADCFNLPYTDNSFDTIFMANLLHVIQFPEKVVAESKRVLKKNGKIIIIDYTLEGMTFFNKIGLIFRYLKTYGKPPSKGQNLTKKDIREIVKSCGFTIEVENLIGNNSKTIFLTATANK